MTGRATDVMTGMTRSDYFSEWPVTCGHPGSLVVMKAFVRIHHSADDARGCHR